MEWKFHFQEVTGKNLIRCIWRARLRTALPHCRSKRFLNQSKSNIACDPVKCGNDRATPGLAHFGPLRPRKSRNPLRDVERGGSDTALQRTAAVSSFRFNKVLKGSVAGNGRLPPYWGLVVFRFNFCRAMLCICVSDALMRWPVSCHVRAFCRNGHSCYEIRIGNPTHTIEWYRFQWPWVISNPYFKVTITQFSRWHYSLMLNIS